MIYQVLSWSCALGGLAAFLYKAPAALRQRTDPALIALCLYFLCSSLSFVVELDQIRTHINALLHHPNITTLLCQALVVVLTAAQQVVLVHWSHPPPRARLLARRRMLGFGAALAVLAVLFFFVNTPTREGTAEVTVALNMENPRYALYFALYLAVCAVGQIGAVRMSLRYARIAHRPWLRRGMRAVTAGGTLILGYCLVRYVEIAGMRLGFDNPWSWLYWTTGSVGSLLQVFGWTVPSWGPKLSAAARWWGEYRAYRQLAPLWWALYRASPQIALAAPPSRWADVLPPRDLRYRLYRRVIEIRDGQLALRPWLDPDAAGREAARTGVASEGPSTAYEALLLRHALRARRDGAPAVGEDASFAHAEHRDLDAEIRWLTEVARCFVAPRAPTPLPERPPPLPR
ncbi:hypothetical protein QNO07_00765 [Streptomyces sp. 549]|uniref:MAB_1171c family putative transporter n=1 Tax=Streptomyces sp. 549 TaxID=3049076 RepID=UPI0024C40AC7|nr:MAB_1171c family putative transporter [Streptomyces sp. 549]MDK1471970.1 hypothetical protein [Streptomyces sp. 549]